MSRTYIPPLRTLHFHLFNYLQDDFCICRNFYMDIFRMGIEASGYPHCFILKGIDDWIQWDPNDAVYKRWSCHGGYKLCENCVETSCPQRWGPDLLDSMRASWSDMITPFLSYLYHVHSPLNSFGYWTLNKYYYYYYYYYHTHTHTPIHIHIHTHQVHRTDIILCII